MGRVGCLDFRGNSGESFSSQLQWVALHSPEWRTHSLVEMSCKSVLGMCNVRMAPLIIILSALNLNLPPF